MKIYSQKGIQKNLGDYDKITDEFYILNVPQSIEKYDYPGDSIKYDVDSELAVLYDTLRNLFFKDIDQYYSESCSMPIFVESAGRDSDSGLTAKDFNDYIAQSRLSNIYKHLYLSDCQYLVGSIQNLLIGMDDIFINYFIKINDIGLSIRSCGLNAVMYERSSSVSRLSSLLENYFIKAYSILDMFCKVVYELELPLTDFSQYNKMKSAKKLWGDRKKLTINGTKNTIFEKCLLIDTIEALRNEVVHNGSWELSPKVFVVFKDGKIVERYMLFPDIEQGHLATVKNRRHFFGLNNKVNIILPKIHMEFMFRVLETAKQINKFS